MAKRKRIYQQNASDAVYAALKREVRRQLLVMATGTGKTFTAVDIISPFKRPLWVTHTEELLEQSGAAMLAEKFPHIDIPAMVDTYGGLTEYVRHVQRNPLFVDKSEAELMKSINIIKADLFGLQGDITIASAQTLYRRLDKIPADYFDVVVADEAHLFGAATFVKPLQYFQPQLLLGLTATPYRSDGVLLADIFDEIVYQYNIGDAINDGYLCELDAIQIRTNIQLDDVHTLGGEFNQKELKATVDTPARNKLIVDSYKKYAEGLQNLIFCVDVEHAQNICNAFSEAGYKSEYIVSDSTLSPDRKALIKRFKNNQTTHLSNVMVLTAGFDHPGIGCVTLACPTKSMNKYIQQLGRSTRTLPGVIDGLETAHERIQAISTSAKPNCKILDIVDITSRHRLINTFELDHELPMEKKVFVTRQKKSLFAEKKRIQIEAKSTQDVRVNLLPLPKVKQMISMRGKDNATEKQLGMLGRLGFDIINGSYTIEMASQLITNSEATDKQVRALKQFNYDTTRGVSRGEAAAAFDEIKAKMEKKRIENEMKESNGVIDDIF